MLRQQLQNSGGGWRNNMPNPGTGLTAVSVTNARRPGKYHDGKDTGFFLLIVNVESRNLARQEEAEQEPAQTSAGPIGSLADQADPWPAPI